MALLHATFFSSVLQKQMAMDLLVPESGRGPFPVLYLLHGLSDDQTVWQRRSSIERYVQDLPLIVALPDGGRSFYTDHAEGPAWGRYMIEDVLGFVERVLPVKRARNGRCIGGLSMGGYGALRLALAHPRLFASAHSHSGALQAGRRPQEYAAKPELRRIFGANPLNSAHDLHALLRRARRAGAPLPKLWIDCGTEDYLLDQSRAFVEFLQREKVPHTYVEHPGAHTWEYWDLHIRAALEFHARALGLKKSRTR